MAEVLEQIHTEQESRAVLGPDPDGPPDSSPPEGDPHPEQGPVEEPPSPSGPPETDPPSENPPLGDPAPDSPPMEEPSTGDGVESPPLNEPVDELVSSPEDAAAAGVLPEELLADAAPSVEPVVSGGDAERRAVLEAIIYITEEPLSAQQIAAALREPIEIVERLLEELVHEYAQPHHGLTIRELAGGYKMATKPEHHEAVRSFVRNLKPPLKLSLPALETLAVIAYKQPITAPEIGEIRGVQGAGVLKTLVDRKLITTAGRKNVVGKPILYKTTKEFLIQFGLKDLSELPTLKEFEELRRLALTEPEPEIAPELLPPEPEEGVPAAGNAEGEAEQQPTETAIAP